jgi:nucleoside phosphorylase
MEVPDMKRAVILTAIPAEYLAVTAHLTDLTEQEPHKGTVYEVGIFENWQVLVAEVGAGNANAGIEAERAITFFNPQVLLFVGVAGGVKDVALGDVVAVTKAYAYESGKESKDGFLARPDVFTSTYDLTQRARTESRKPDWKARIAAEPTPSPTVYIGPIAAGERVVAETKSVTFKFIKQTYNDTLAVEMEGAGCLAAAYKNSTILALVVRGISDLIDNKEEDDAEGSQSVAAAHASAFAFQVLSKLNPDPANP